MKQFFTLSEFFTTDTNLPNEVKNVKHVENILDLMKVLNVVRALVGCAVTVTSGYRSSEVNKAVGGVDSSHHLSGRAADITCEDITKLYDICQKLHFQGIFLECYINPIKNYIHVAI